MTPAERDALIRTVIGEAGGEPPVGQAAVTHVILNRAALGRYGGTDIQSVVHAPHQFEPWATRKDELNAISPSSPAYQKVASVVDSVVAGKVPDPTGGATHFIDPKLQTGRGDAIPTWAQGTPNATIGAHSFYSPDGRSRAAPSKNALAVAAANGSAVPAPDFANDFVGVPRPDVNATFGTPRTPGPDFGAAFPAQQGGFGPAAPDSAPSGGPSNVMAQLRMLQALMPPQASGHSSNALQALNIMAPHISIPYPLNGATSNG